MRFYYAVFLVIMVAIVIVAGATGPASGTEGGKAVTSTEDGVEDIAVGNLYLVEFRGPCGPPLMPSFLADKVMSSLVESGMLISSGGQPPLVSRTDLIYSMVVVEGESELRTGRIYAEVGPGSELFLKGADGKSAVLQVDVNQVCWDLDRAAALSDAKGSKADYAIVGRFQVDDLTADVNAVGGLGKQKSFRVTLELAAIAVADGQVIAVFSDERRQMDLSAEGAIAKAAKYLADKASAYLKEMGEKRSLKWWTN